MVHNCYYKGIALGWFLGLYSACVCKWSDVRSNVPNMSIRIVFLQHPQVLSVALLAHHIIELPQKGRDLGEERNAAIRGRTAILSLNARNRGISSDLYSFGNWDSTARIAWNTATST